MLRIYVLGELRVEAGDRLLPPARPKQRTVLALLVARANRTVSLDALAAELWPDTPPEAAVANLRTYVTSIRRDLGPVYRERLVTTPIGYRLVVEPGETDLDEVEALATEARADAAAGRLDQARTGYDAALARVERGEPLADVPLGSGLEMLRGMLTERFMALAEERYALHIATGYAEPVTPALRAHVRAHPLRESAYALLVRARHAAGDVPDALRICREARTVLRDELGLDLGPDLQALQKSILDGTATAPTGLTSPTAPAPRMLPRDVAGFIGRDCELGAIAERLTAPGNQPVIVAVHGVGGVGKSALVVHAAHRMRERYPDGQLYVDLHGTTPGMAPVEAGEALARLLRALGTPAARVPDDLADATEAYQALLAGRRVLVLVDNVPSASAAEPLLPRSGGSAALLTSREVLTSLNGGSHLPLHPFPPEEAMAFLRELGGADPKPAIAEVARACGHLALPLRVMAARRASRPDWTYADLAARLSDESGRLDEMAYADLDVRAALRLGYDMLAAGQRDRDRTAAAALRVLGQIPLPWWTAAPVAAALDTHPLAARRALDTLVAARLAEPAGDRYTLHDLTRLMATELAAAAPEPERAAIAQRLIGWYVRRAEAADALVRPAAARPADPDAIATIADATAFLDEERAPLLAVAAYAASLDLSSDAVARILNSAGWHWARHGQWADEERLAELTVEVAARGSDPRCLADALVALGRVCGRRRRYDQAAAHMHAARNHYRTSGDRVGQLRTDAELGLLAKFAGDYPAAVDHLRRALDLALSLAEATAGDESPAARRGVAVVGFNLSLTYGALGRFADARNGLERSLAIRRAIGDRTGEAITMVALGPAQANTGDWATGGETLDAGLALCGELNLRIDLGYGHAFRSVFRLRTGDLEAGLADALAAIETLEPLDEPVVLARAHRQAARAYEALNRPEPAVDHHAVATRLLTGVAAPPMTDMDLFFAG